MMKLSIMMLLTLLISACNQQQSEQGRIEQKNEKQLANTEKIAISDVIQMQEVPFDFTYMDLNNKEIKLSDYRGKWVVVNYWATWCPPCRKEIPDFVKFKTMFADQVEVLGIDNEDAEIEVIEKFVKDFKINYPILQTDVYNPTEYDKANTKGLPTTLVYNPSGVQAAKRVGPVHFKDLLEMTGLEVKE